jgi:hypothetical protein
MLSIEIIYGCLHITLISLALSLMLRESGLTICSLESTSAALSLLGTASFGASPSARFVKSPLHVDLFRTSAFPLSGLPR